MSTDPGPPSRHSLHGKSPDLGHFVEKAPASEDEMLLLLTKHWTPPKDFTFPVTEMYNKKRKFQRHWLDTYSWLVYSPAVDGALCKHCMMFATGGDKGKFVRTPFRNWNKAVDEIKEHSSLAYHQDAMAKSEKFVYNMRNPEATIKCKLNEEVAKQISTNRQILASVFKCVIFCGKQNLALRGHRDDGIREETNRSMFNALLNFRIDAGDEVLKKHLASCDERASYISKTTQNRMIEIVGEQIRENILKEVKSARYFAVLADEVTDTSNWEQMSLVLRFVDSQQDIREEFLAFVPCEEVSGEGLTNKIVEKLEEWGLDVADIRGQAYDGAANMAGKFKGVKSRILELNDKALFFHCASHCLSLCVVKACQVPYVKNMMGTMKQLALFFSNSPKRQRKLEQVIGDAMPDSRKEKLVDLCRTRWVEKIQAFETFALLFKPVIDCLGQITEDKATWDSKAVIEASGLLSNMSCGSFLTAFIVTQECLQYLKPLTVKLQKVAQDVSSAYKEVADITQCIKDLRDTVDKAFHVWFQKARTMAQTLGVTIEKPRVAGRQTLRDNQPADTPEVYYRITVAVPFLDHLCTELQSRFQNSQLAGDGLQLVPSCIAQLPKGFTSLPDGIEGLASLWEADLPAIGGIQAEIHRWAVKWCTAAESCPVPTTLVEALKHCDSEYFPNIHKMLQLLCTLPITTAECERTNSSLRILKNFMRSTMVEDRLNGLALMCIHWGMTIDIEAAVDTFAQKFRTHMTLLPKHLLKM